MKNLDLFCSHLSIFLLYSDLLHNALCLHLHCLLLFIFASNLIASISSSHMIIECLFYSWITEIFNAAHCPGAKWKCINLLACFAFYYHYLLHHEFQTDQYCKIVLYSKSLKLLLTRGVNKFWQILDKYLIHVYILYGVYKLFINIHNK